MVASVDSAVAWERLLSPSDVPAVAEYQADVVRTLNVDQNERAWQDAGMWWDGPRRERIRAAERDRREPPLPRQPRLPRFAASSAWVPRAAGCDAGRGGRDAAVDRTDRAGRA